MQNHSKSEREVVLGQFPEKDLESLKQTHMQILFRKSIHPEYAVRETETKTRERT